MNYKGYEARVELDDEAGVFHGEVINTRDVITFQGSSVEELKQAFEDSVDDYLEFCASRGEDPEKRMFWKNCNPSSPPKPRNSDFALSCAAKRRSAHNPCHPPHSPRVP